MKTLRIPGSSLLKPAVLAAVLLAVGGCAGPVAASTGEVRAAASGTPSITASASAPLPGTGPVVANGHGWTAAGLEGPMPGPGTCHVRVASDGGELPDPKCTPGSVDPTVTDANMDSTLGKPGGYTDTVRPPVNLTEAAKKQLMAAYGIPWSEASKYELDHLTPLCSAGSSDVRNLWPQNRREFFSATDENRLENRLQGAVCFWT
ncbi:hypothetical protein ABH924_003781 [Arthrobacter sp. GAS37]|uniref:hypothetical protein n=1 Tax=Arthrobacter sp. GAS37 TaxID=3156261 RepID=UPI003836A15E